MARIAEVMSPKAAVTGAQDYVVLFKEVVVSKSENAKRRKGRKTLAPSALSMWEHDSDSKSVSVGQSDKGRIKKKDVRGAMDDWPRWWENGFVRIHKYGGPDAFLKAAASDGDLFRVLEVRSRKKSGKCDDEKRRNYRDTLFLEPESGTGLFKVYAGEAWVELVREPPEGDDYGDDDVDWESDEWDLI